MMTSLTLPKTELIKKAFKSITIEYGNILSFIQQKKAKKRLYSKMMQV
jgi:hypothetical protein